MLNIDKFLQFAVESTIQLFRETIIEKYYFSDILHNFSMEIILKFLVQSL